MVVWYVSCGIKCDIAPAARSRRPSLLWMFKSGVGARIKVDIIRNPANPSPIAAATAAAITATATATPAAPTTVSFSYAAEGPPTTLSQPWTTCLSILCAVVRREVKLSPLSLANEGGYDPTKLLWYASSCLLEAARSR